jgi:hypothetical protein
MLILSYLSTSDEVRLLEVQTPTPKTLKGKLTLSQNVLVTTGDETRFKASGQIQVAAPMPQ